MKIIDAFWLDLPYRLLLIVIPENNYTPALWPMDLPELLMKLAKNDGA